MLALLGGGVLKPNLGYSGQADLLQYWGTSKLVALGANPYDPSILGEIERNEPTTGRTLSYTIIMWNPPLILPLISWLSEIDFVTARYIWIGLSLASILFSTGAIGYLNKLTPNFRIIVPLILFFPIYTLLYWGQISWILLLGLTGGILYSSQGRYFLAGISLSFLLIKPHLMYLTLLGIFTQANRSQKISLISGFGVFGITLSLTAELMSPGVWKNWIQSLETPPHYFMTPTIGSFLQGWFPDQSEWIRYLPAIVLLCGLALSFRSKFTRSLLNDPIGLIPLSLVTSPYGWAYDQVLLLPLVIRVAAHSNLKFSIALTASHLLAFLPQLSQQHHFVWYPVILIILNAISIEYNRRFPPTSNFTA